eukprot:EG_transcript_23528
MALTPQLNKVFQEAVALTTPESIQQHARSAAPMDPERRAFLEAALKATTYDVVAKMKEHVEVLNREGTPEDELVAALEGLQFECEQMDFAADLHKIGGFGTVVALLGHDSPEVRMSAAWVLATCANQNPAVQQQAQQYDLLPTVLSKLKVEADVEVTQKLLLCVSALVRGNPQAHQPFVALKGYEVVGALCEHRAVKVRRKAVFFLFTMLQQEPEPGRPRLACDTGLLPALRAALAAADGDEDVLHQSLNALALLVPVDPAVRAAAEACG